MANVSLLGDRGEKPLYGGGASVVGGKSSGSSKQATVQPDPYTALFNASRMQEMMRKRQAAGGGGGMIERLKALKGGPSSVPVEPIQ